MIWLNSLNINDIHHINNLQQLEHLTITNCIDTDNNDLDNIKLLYKLLCEGLNQLHNLQTIHIIKADNTSTLTRYLRHNCRIKSIYIDYPVLECKFIYGNIIVIIHIKIDH